MPPLSKENQTVLQKRVDFVTKDDDAQVAAGIVMVPDKVDLQNDFVREETIRSFADQFGTFYEAGEAGGGIMHAVFPSEWMDLERNEVLDEAEEIGGETVDAGAWVQEWAINDDGLWGLIQDDIIAGYSIGAMSAQWDGPYEQDEVDDVDTSEIPEDELVYELVDGIVREVSNVDIPAVPDAMILDTKAAGAAQKRLGDYLGDPDGFIEEALQRGHSEEEAERLWEHLNRAIEVEGSGEPGTKGRITEAAKTFIDAVTGIASSGKTAGRGDVDHGEQADKDAAGGETPADDGGSNSADSDTMSNDADEPPEWAKELQEQIDEQSKRIDEALDTDDDGSGKDAGGDDPFEDAPEWAQSLKEDVDKQGERIDQISKQTGATESQQLTGAEKGGGDDDGLDRRQKFFIPESKQRELASGRGGR